jgi:hypothetical protein
VMISVEQALEVAEACAAQSWGGVTEAFILVMALSGLRPGEAAGLLWDDVDLPVDGQGSGWVTVRRTHRPVAARWLDPGEDADWGPLKDRDLTESRRAPIPPLLVSKLAAHRERYGPGPGGLVFHRNGKPFDHDLFNYAVWRAARGFLWPLREGMASDDPASPSWPGCDGTTSATRPAPGGCGRGSTPSSASDGRGTRHFPSSSASIRGWRRGGRRKGWRGSRRASEGNRSNGARPSP